jgi:hypothetical protein
VQKSSKTPKTPNAPAVWRPPSDDGQLVPTASRAQRAGCSAHVGFAALTAGCAIGVERCSEGPGSGGQGSVQRGQGFAARDKRVSRLSLRCVRVARRQGGRKGRGAQACGPPPVCVPQAMAFIMVRRWLIMVRRWLLGLPGECEVSCS